MKVEVASLFLAIGVSSVGILLMIWQLLERGHRLTATSEDDHRHFANQAIRRYVVSGMMILLSIGLYAGSRMEPKISGKPNLLFVQTWLWVLLLVLLLLVLAVVDWFATRVYSQRHRKAIVREGMDILRDEIRVRAALKNDVRRTDESNGSFNH